jgi:hypothetical protein
MKGTVMLYKRSVMLTIVLGTLLFTATAFLSFASTCFNSFAASGECFSGEPEEPDLVNQGWSCELESIARLFELPGGCVGTSGSKYKTEGECKITWKCKKLGEESVLEDTSEGVNTDYDQSKSGSCLCIS